MNKKAGKKAPTKPPKKIPARKPSIIKEEGPGKTKPIRKKA